MTVAADIETEDSLREEQIRILSRLTAMGMALLETIHGEIEAGLPDEPNPTKRLAALSSASIAHARTARSVRLTLDMRQRLKDGAAEDIKPGQLDIVWLSDLEDEQEPAAEHGAEASPRRDRERDDLADLRKRPPAEQIAHICRDLNLDPETSERFQQAWAQSSPPPAELAGGGPLADPGLWPGEERVVEGAGGYDTAHFSSA